MEPVFQCFQRGYGNGDGYALSDTLSPIPPASQPDRLSNFFRSTNFSNVKRDCKQGLLRNSEVGMTEEEYNGWVEVYVAYWKAVGELLAADAAPKSNSKVRYISFPPYYCPIFLEYNSCNIWVDSSSVQITSLLLRVTKITAAITNTLFRSTQLTFLQPAWTRTYDAWKELTSVLHRGYSNHGFPSWTLPCLYVAGKFLRIFAIKADEGTSTTTSAVTSFGDDLNPDSEKNEKLEDAARQLNRIFNLCLSDRFVSVMPIISFLIADHTPENQILPYQGNGASTTLRIYY